MFRPGRAGRDGNRPRHSGAARHPRLEEAARGTENLLPCILECVEANATVGEISNRLRNVWGEYKETATV